ncbi:MAG TPA: LppX_LprAFG lipoprotein [Nitrolancea sp.]|nr:LppX_LprAFG lipoprotein [Nitrolancea sp.]
MSDAATRFGQVSSLHFVLQIDGTVALDQANTLKLHGAEGDLSRPDSAQAKASVSFLGATISIKFVSIGKDQYITNPITGAWETAPGNLGYDPAVLYDNSKGIGHVLTALQNPKIVGRETVNGTDTYHISATVAASDAQPIAGGAIQSASPAIDLWISKQNSDLVKFTLRDATAAGTNPTTWTLLLSKQNVSVTIQRPNV